MGSIIENIINIAKENKKKIVLPEATDIRILMAAEIAIKENFADIILIGKEEEIKDIANKNNIDISKAQIIYPQSSRLYKEYVNKFYELRNKKGIDLDSAKKYMLDNVYFATMMVKNGDADGLVSGAIHSTADTLRPALQIIKAKDNIKTVSSFFLMETKNKELGEDGVFIFADCGLVEVPTEEQLVDITLASVNSFRTLIKKEPKVALLSYSTKGSAKSLEVDKIVNVKNKLDSMNVDFLVDGELQLDAAIIPNIAKTKAPDSNLVGGANILIFPDIQSGNIGYKLVQRFGNALAIGPVTQGLKLPVNDLSRGCNKEDIVGAIALTCVQANNI